MDANKELEKLEKLQKAVELYKGFTKKIEIMNIPRKTVHSR